VNVSPSRRIFLSASVPLPTRDRTADVLAIRDAVRALTMVILEQDVQLVFGGHPAITPMIRLQIAQTGTPVGSRVVVFQSRFFEPRFPTDNVAFERVEVVDSVAGDRTASLVQMREKMLAGPFELALFIGGMEGVEDEYAMFAIASGQTGVSDCFHACSGKEAIRCEPGSSAGLSGA
jgi:hypothetical protein